MFTKKLNKILSSFQTNIKELDKLHNQIVETRVGIGSEIQNLNKQIVIKNEDDLKLRKEQERVNAIKHNFQKLIGDISE
jgi:predicted phage-related endonuclease